MEPIASRPHMPGYGMLPPGAGGELLLPWSWARKRLRRSREYWLATVRPDGRPHVMPVWGVWLADGLWFSTSPGSRKGRNLAVTPCATLTTDNPREPVVVEGVATRVVDRAAIARFTAETNEKYVTDYPVSFYLASACFRLRPVTVFGLLEVDFAGTPTRWTFPPADGG